MKKQKVKFHYGSKKAARSEFLRRYHGYTPERNPDMFAQFEKWFSAQWGFSISPQRGAEDLRMIDVSDSQ